MNAVSTELTTRMIDSVRALVEIESPSDNPDACRRCMVTASELSQAWLGSPGAIHEYHGQPLHIWGSRTPQVLILGHLDTVWPIGTLQRIPWSCDGEVMRGPGVFDMKVGVVQAWVALHLAGLGVDDGVSILLTSDEEIGSPLSREVIEAFARKAAFVFNSEPGRPSGNVVTGRKGGIFLEMDIQGKAAHSGGNFSEGINAISEIANKIIELDKLTDIDEGLTVSVGLISGGQSVNTSAPSAKAAIDVRVKDLAQREQVMSRIQCICNKNFITGTLAKLSVIGEFKPFVPTAASQKLFELYRDTLKDIGYQTDQEFSGGCADSGVTSSLGAITLCGTGPVGGKFHTPDEYTEIDSFLPRAKAVLLTIGKVHAAL
jgi:glutamate carboxypeptidase